MNYELKIAAITASCIAAVAGCIVVIVLIAVSSHNTITLAAFDNGYEESILPGSSVSRWVKCGKQGD